MCARASALPPLPRAPSQPSYPTPSTPLRPFLQLHVFAKLAGETDDFAKVFVADGSDVGDLKKAIVTELKLDATPDRVRLLLEVEGGAPVPLDSRKALAGQGVLEGASVVVEVMGLNLGSFFNVLACAPSSAHSSQLLSALRSPSTNDLQRLRIFRQLLLDLTHPTEDLPLPLFETQAHQALLRTLVAHTNQLDLGEFQGNNGPACRTLVGARGIGKTALLRAFARVAPSAFPNVIVLYASGAGITDSANPFTAWGCLSSLTRQRQRGALRWGPWRRMAAAPASMRPSGRRVCACCCWWMRWMSYTE